MRRIDLIVIHCTASRPNQHISMELLHQMHRARGWRCCGYHYYITRDGQLHIGRPEEEIGAHARHYNAHSIGICYEGGLDDKGHAADTRTPAQRAALIALLRSLKVDYPRAEIVGHCEFEGVHKDCPCFDVSEYRDYFENLPLD
jgi:N-acetyl-anhydromuramyl-L-alanine amidase AmpD